MTKTKKGPKPSEAPGEFHTPDEKLAAMRALDTEARAKEHTLDGKKEECKELQKEIDALISRLRTFVQGSDQDFLNFEADPDADRE